MKLVPKGFQVGLSQVIWQKFQVILGQYLDYVFTTWELINLFLLFVHISWKLSILAGTNNSK